VATPVSEDGFGQGQALGLHVHELPGFPGQSLKHWTCAENRRSLNKIS
jgi:hypothetical protein